MLFYTLKKHQITWFWHQFDT